MPHIQDGEELWGGLYILYQSGLYTADENQDERGLALREVPQKTEILTTLCTVVKKVVVQRNKSSPDCKNAAAAPYYTNRQQGGGVSLIQVYAVTEE